MGLFYNNTAVSQANSVFINNQSANQVFYNNTRVWQKQFFLYNNGSIGVGNIWIHWSAYPNNYEFSTNENGKLTARGGYGDTQLKIISGGFLLMCDKEAIEVQKILPFLSDTWPLCRIGRAVIRASQSCRQSCNKYQCSAWGCRSRHSCTHVQRFSLQTPETK